MHLSNRPINPINPLLEFVRVLCTESGTAGKEATKKKKKKLKSKSKKGTSGATVTIASSIAVTSSDFTDAKTSSDKVDLQYLKRKQQINK